MADTRVVFSRGDSKAAGWSGQWGAGLLLLALALALSMPSSADAAGGGTISGRVTDGSGIPLVLGTASAYRASDGAHVASSWIILGQYRLDLHADGDYKVYFVDSSGANASEFFDDKFTLATADAISVRGGKQVTANASLSTGGWITGRVRSSTGPPGIGDVTVAAYRADTNAFVTSAKTDSTGAYRLPTLTPGAYKLFFSAPAASGWISQYYDNELTLADADPVTVSARKTTSVKDAVLTKGGEISGRVTGADGKGLAAAKVAAYTTAGVFVTSTTTAADGTYALPTVPAGEYKVGFFGPTDSPYRTEYFDDRPTLEAANTVKVNGGKTTGVNARLALQTRISGTVTDARGRGVERVTVYAYRADTGAGVRGVYTKADGSYDIDLDPGTYKLIFAPPDGSPLLSEYYDNKPNRDQATPIKLASGRTITGIDAVLEPGAQITGKLTDASGKPVPGATATAYSLDGSSVASATADASGTYTIARLRPGSYKLGFSGPAGQGYKAEYHRNAATLADADRLTIAAGAARTVNADLAKLGGIEGRVVDTSTKKAIAGASVTVYRSSGEQAASVIAGKDGSYVVKNLPAGSYKLRFAGPKNSRYVAEYHNDKPTLAAASAVKVMPGRNVTVTGKLFAPPVPGTLSGKVVSTRGGGAIAGATVTVYPATGSSKVASTTTNSKGAFVVADLPPGQYRIWYAGPVGGRFVAEYYRDRPTLASANLVRIRSGQTTTAGAKLTEILPPSEITGRVLVSPKKGIAGVKVTAYDAKSAPAATAVTGADGKYSLSVPQGYYRMRFDAPTGSGFRSQFWHGAGTLASTPTLKALAGRTRSVAAVTLSRA